MRERQPPRRASAGGKAKDPAAAAQVEPDQRLITERQAQTIASRARVPAESLAGRPIVEVASELRWRVDPHFFSFRRICGRVVRRDPVTGVIHGVPNATVHVQDTDCSFLGFFPVEDPWALWWWLWPIRCWREEIATTTTDPCGRFCVWVPWFDIDRILRFRLERECYPDIVKPNIRDLIDRLREVELPRFPVDPNPPDPAPFELDRDVIRQLEPIVGADATRTLISASGRGFGESRGDVSEALSAPAFAGHFPAPVDGASLERLLGSHGQHEAFQAAVSKSGGIEQLLEAPAVGPFLRCRDVIVAEWETIVDVPDITFLVTQDVDADGTEETIYAESYFDVRWNAGAIPDVMLEAAPWALVSETCDGPDIPCESTPAIRTVGLMPLEATHHDLVNGFSIRVNRPRHQPVPGPWPDSLPSDPPVGPAQAPYAGTLQLHGCHHIAGASYYRLLYAFGAASEVPFTGLEWYAPRLLPGPPFHIVPDANGWYPILPEAELVFPHWLLNWPSTSYPDGKYTVRLEVGNGAKSHIAYSAPIAFTTDNKAPNAGFSQIRWRPSGGAWQNTYTWPFDCIVIRRPASADIELEVNWWASAAHFRSASLGAGGCKAGNDPIPTSGAATFAHWHSTTADNSLSRAASLSIPGTFEEGAYSVNIAALSRAFNPAGDGGGPGIDWLTDYAYSGAWPGLNFAVINA